MGLSTSKLRTHIAESITESDHRRLEMKLDSVECEFEDLTRPSTWKRLKKFKLGDGRVVRYFRAAVDHAYPDFREPDARIVSDPTDTEVLECRFGDVRHVSDIVFRVFPHDHPMVSDMYDDPEYGDICIVGATIKDYTEDDNCIDDASLASPYMPPGFHESMESIFEYNGTRDAARAALLEHGFVEDDEMLSYMYLERPTQTWEAE